MEIQKYNEGREIEIGKVAQIIEDAWDKTEESERYAQHLAELAQLDVELTKKKVQSFRFLERLERKKAARSRARMMFCVLVFICHVDELRAMALCALADAGWEHEPADGVA